METILTIPRVKLTRRVPLVETEKLVNFHVERPSYHPMLVKRTTEVMERSYMYFCKDETYLLSLMAAVNSNEFTVSVRTQMALSTMLTDVYSDGLTFKGFEDSIEPLLELSQSLEEMTKLTDKKVDDNSCYAEEIGELIGVKIPREIPLGP